MIESSVWEKILQHIHNGKKFVLTTHLNPDGDAIGSEMALAHFLSNLNKQVTIINISPTAENYQFLDPLNNIIVFNSQHHAKYISEADVFLIVDISDWKRLSELGKLIKKSSASI